MPAEREVLLNEELAQDIYKMVVYSPRIARAARAGQFILLMVEDRGERVPMTLVDWDKERGTIEMAYQAVGATTVKMSMMKPGERLYYLAGPLGQPSRVKLFGRVVIVGGGVGIPAIYPIARELKRLGNYVVSIIGARTSTLITYEDRIREVSDEVHITTDDGSRGLKGYTVDALKRLLDSGERFDAAWAVGPALMMKSISEAAAGRIPVSYSSLNSLMVCGVGMCGACRITVGGQIKLTCVDGPEFDSYSISWNELAIRLRTYRKEEMISLETMRSVGRV